MDPYEELIWYTSGSGIIEFQLSVLCVNDIAQQGSNDSAVRYWEERIDLSHIPAAAIRDELDEYGCWHDDELADELQNRRRLIWLAAWDIAEEVSCEL